MLLTVKLQWGKVIRHYPCRRERKKIVRQASASSWEWVFLRVPSFSISITTSSLCNFLYQRELPVLCFDFFQSFPFWGRLASALCVGFLSHWNRSQTTSFGGLTTALLVLPQGLWKLWPAKLHAVVLWMCKPTFKQQIEGPWPVGHSKCTMVNVCLDTGKFGLKLGFASLSAVTLTWTKY